MKATVEDLLKKINYIEADVEIHKQILFSIPSADTAAMEETIRLIADKKAEIKDLRRQISALNPEEYKRILRFEEVLAEFKTLAATRNFTAIIGKNVNEPCALQLKGDAPIECLVKACDAAGSWTIITHDGQLRHFTADMVDEEVPSLRQQPLAD
jgi:rRNA-processing protein FCF1